MVHKKIQKHIEIIRSTITSLSSLSLESCDALYVVLKRHYAKVGVSTVNSLADLERLVAKQPDLVFMGMKYVPGDAVVSGRPVPETWVSSYLDYHGISYTG